MQQRRNTILVGMLGVVWGLAAAAPAGAVPFQPETLARLKADGTLPARVTAMERARTERGLNRPTATARGWLLRPEGLRTVPDRDAIVILVDFDDHPADPAMYPAAHYDSLLFSEGAYPTGSMRDWYLENSYGAFHVSGEVTDWLRMPESYAYYVDGQAGFGSYPQNAQKLAEDAVAAADPTINFAHYDNDGPDGIPNSGDDDGYVDALFVVHAGPGREQTGSDDDIHSHAWAMASAVAVDGVLARSYSMEPEDGRIGVFGHEFGHVLGLPDLYDTDYSSSGIGAWGMMSGGSWGDGGRSPAHFISWSKMQLGFVAPQVPRGNLAGAALPEVESSPTIYRLWTGGYPETEYFLVENRQQAGFDASLPGAGLLICHVDDRMAGNQDETHPLVAVEQADGLEQLAAGEGADDGDPWPGSTENRDFTVTSSPNSNDYDGLPTQVAVRNVSDSGAAMTADLEVENAPIPRIADYETQETSGNGDGNIDPGESWAMPLTLFNRGLTAQSATATLGSSEPGVTIANAVTGFDSLPAESLATGTPPFEASLAAGATQDGLVFTVAVDDGRTATNLPLLLGVNDSLKVFRWSHARVTPSYGDQWHLGTDRNHTPGGSYAWKCGSSSGGDYNDRLDAALTTVPLPLATISALRFWHWIDAEEGSGSTAWDGAIVEASVDGSPWAPISPDGGYPYTIVANPASPFAPETPCYSGLHDWEEARFDLAALTGDYVQLRFRFGSDGAATEEGWYIDDVSIEGSLAAGLEREPRPAARLYLARPQPNPAATGVTLQFVRPANQAAQLQLLDVAGRQLAAWQFPATGAGGMLTQTLRWEGNLPGGGRPTSGAYFLRLRAGAEQATRRLLWVR